MCHIFANKRRYQLVPLLICTLNNCNQWSRFAQIIIPRLVQRCCTFQFVYVCWIELSICLLWNLLTLTKMTFSMLRFSFQLSKSLGNALWIIKALGREKKYWQTFFETFARHDYEKDGILERRVLMSFWTIKRMHAGHSLKFLSS